MRPQIWNTVLNVLITLFWFRLWCHEDRSLFFNPHLSTLERLSDTMIRFMRPLFTGIPERAIPAILVIFLLVLRALMIAFGAPLPLSLGFELAWPIAGNLLSCLLFSVLSFAIFLFMLWSLSLVYVRTRFSSQSHHTLNAVDSLARPFSHIRTEFRPPTLLATGIVLAAILALASTRGPHARPFHTGPYALLFFRLTLSALAGWTNILAVICRFMLLLVIVSWAAMFANSRPMAYFCNQWLSFLLGPLRRCPLVIGTFNLTPLVFMLAAWFVHGQLMRLLYQAWLTTQ